MDLILKYFTDFTDEQIRQFRLLEPLYREWNEKINVISRKDIDSLYEKHVLHSLSIAATFELTEGMTVLDLGTGGGFPGIVIAIHHPEAKLTLIDSIQKKVNVVKDIVKRLELKNAEVICIRAEDLAKNSEYVKKFDYVVARSVAVLQDLCKWSKDLLKTGGKLITVKGGNIDGEIKAAGRLKYIKLDEVIHKDLRKLIVVKY